MRNFSDVKVQLVDYICDECKESNMEYTGNMIFTYPEQYEHKCNNCGNVKNFNVKYPEVVYTYIKNK